MRLMAGLLGQHEPAGAEVSPEHEAVAAARDDIEIAVGIDVADGRDGDRLGRKQNRPSVTRTVDADERPAGWKIDEVNRRERPQTMVMTGCRHRRGQRDQRQERSRESLNERPHQFRR